MARAKFENPQGANPEQLLYARVLEVGMLLGLVVLLITFLLYITGIMDPYLAMKDLPHYWSMPVNEYLHEASIHAGWSWLGMLKYGDFLNFIGIVLLAGTTLVCYGSVVPLLLKQGDKVYAVIAVLEVLVLGLAASGILASGH